MREALRQAASKVSRRRRDLLRIGLQTAVATAAVYLAITWLDAPHLSWAVIAALFTIGISADASYANALGRIAGAFLGAGLGLAAAGSGAPVLAGLVVAATLANMIAAVWPSLRYAAVTAAIVALEPDPEAGDAVLRALTIVLGSIVGVAASFVIWPVLGRSRAAEGLRGALEACQDMVEVMLAGDPDDAGNRARRDAAQTAFLGHLQAARERVAQTRFRPTLPNGGGLGEAVEAVEGVRYALAILDRAVVAEVEAVDRDTIERLRPAVDAVERVACVCLGRLAAATRMREPPAPPTGELRAAVARAREAVAASGRPREGSDRGGLEALAALGFALNELERRLVELSAIVAGGAPRRGERPRPAHA